MILSYFRKNDLKYQLLEIRNNKKIPTWKKARTTENSKKIEKKSTLTQLFILTLPGRTQKIQQKIRSFSEIPKKLTFQNPIFFF